MGVKKVQETNLEGQRDPGKKTRGTQYVYMVKRKKVESRGGKAI